MTTKLTTTEAQRAFLVAYGAQVTTLNMATNDLAGPNFTGTEAERAALLTEGLRIMTRIGMVMHGQLCAEYGISPQDLTNEVAEQAMQQITESRQDATLTVPEPATIQ